MLSQHGSHHHYHHHPTPPLPLLSSLDTVPLLTCTEVSLLLIAVPQYTLLDQDIRFVDLGVN